ncbi:MAG: hypothetical protein KME40_32330 [Komarekiella atlantica HA4396-MV6]|jgi:hypothetical protein|nr:hypothetical protein [Komarekiella atlantica HA4396-MV6]
MILGCEIITVEFLLLTRMQREVKVWNSNEWVGGTRITSQLLNYWFEEDQVRNNMPGEIYQ